MKRVTTECMVTSGASELASDAAAPKRVPSSASRSNVRSTSAQQVPSRLAGTTLPHAVWPQHAVLMTARMLSVQLLKFQHANASKSASQRQSTAAKSSIASATRADASSSVIATAQQAMSFSQSSRESAATDQSASGSNALQLHTFHQLTLKPLLLQLTPPQALSPALQVPQRVHHHQSSVSMLRAVSDTTVKTGAHQRSHARSTHATLSATSR